MLVSYYWATSLGVGYKNTRSAASRSSPTTLGEGRVESTLEKSARTRVKPVGLGSATTAFKPMRRGPGSLAYDACEMYDVGAVERLLLKTALARRCPELNVKLDMDLPWSRLDGSFCRRYEAAAVAKRAHFNQNPFAMLKHPSGP